MCVNVCRPMCAPGTLALAAVRPHGLAVMFLVLAALPGCDRAPDRFQVNRVFARNQKLAESVADFAAPNVSRRMGDIERVVTQYFGTPSEPTVAESEGVALDSLFQLSNLQMAAGSVRRAADGTTHGLYRRHCVQCHGLTGDGVGSSARVLDPYPRDYRRGIFKYKRTPSTLPPLNEDLHAVLDRGVPGTAMPSFRRLPESEKTALVQYVRYLSIRGLFERAVMTEVAVELDDDDQLLSLELKEISPTRYAQQVKWLDAILAEVVQPWLDASAQTTAVPPPPANYNSPQSIARTGAVLYDTHQLRKMSWRYGIGRRSDGRLRRVDEGDRTRESGGGGRVSRAGSTATSQGPAAQSANRTLSGWTTPRRPVRESQEWHCGNYHA